MRNLRSTLILSGTLLSTFSISGSAAAFAEDACYLPNGGGLANCVPLPAACKSPFPNTSQACLAAALAAFVQQGAQFPDGGRSTIHSDATHLLAQALGLSSDDAYWVAAYDEATDLGTFEPRDASGVPVGGGALATASIDGLVRTNLQTGGVLLHFGAPRPTSGIDGLHPDADNPSVEPLLAHVRAWAVAGTGATKPACAAGITKRVSGNNYATGTSCYLTPGGASATVQGALAAIGQVAVPFNVATGPQIVSTEGGVKTSEQFGSVVGAANEANARLGVYVHALADRVSHHVCLDASSFTGPTGGGTLFTEDMSNGACAQAPHALKHLWETGVDFSKLAATDRTTEAGLGEVYDELSAFAKARGLPGAPTSGPNARATLVADLLAALSIEDAAARVTAIHDEACARGFEPFPGTPPCNTPTAPPTLTLRAPDRSAPLLDDADAPSCAASTDRPPHGGRQAAIATGLLFAFVAALIARRKQAETRRAVATTDINIGR